MKKEFFCEALEGIDEKYLTEHIKRKHPTNAQKIKKYIYAAGAYIAAILIVAAALPFVIRTEVDPNQPVQTKPPVQVDPAYSDETTAEYTTDVITDEESTITEPSDTELSEAESSAVQDITETVTVEPSVPETISPEVTAPPETESEGTTKPPSAVTESRVVKPNNSNAAATTPVNTKSPVTQADKTDPDGTNPPKTTADTTKPPVTTPSATKPNAPALNTEAYGKLVTQTEKYGLRYSMYFNKDMYDADTPVVVTVILENTGDEEIELYNPYIENFLENILFVVDNSVVRGYCTLDYYNRPAMVQYGSIKPGEHMTYTEKFTPYDPTMVNDNSASSPANPQLNWYISASCYIVINDSNESLSLKAEIPHVTDPLTAYNRNADVTASGTSSAEAAALGCTYSIALDGFDEIGRFKVKQTLKNTSSENAFYSSSMPYLSDIGFYVDGTRVEGYSSTDNPSGAAPNIRELCLKSGESVSVTTEYWPSGKSYSTSSAEADRLPAVNYDAKWEIKATLYVIKGTTVQSIAVSIEIPHSDVPDEYVELPDVTAAGMNFAEADALGCTYKVSFVEYNSEGNFTVLQTLTNTGSEAVTLRNPHSANNFLTNIKLYVNGVEAVGYSSNELLTGVEPIPTERTLNPGESISYLVEFDPYHSTVEGSVPLDPSGVWEVRAERSVIKDNIIQKMIVTVDIYH